MPAAMTAGWNHVAARFRTFLQALTPSPTDRRRALDAAAAVGDVIDAHFAGRHADGCGSIVIGGIAKDTAVPPITALDLISVLPTPLRPPADRLPDVLIQVRDVLAVHFSDVAIADCGHIVATVPAPGTSIRVNVHPGFPFNCAGWLVPSTAPGGRGAWRAADPAAEHRHLVRADHASAGKATHLVRLLKAWRRAHAVDISPFAMELLAVEFVRLWPYRQASLLFYDWMLRDALFWLAAQAGRSIPMPGTAEPLAVGAVWQPAAEAAWRLAALACDLERDNGRGATAAWHRLLGMAVGNAGATGSPVRSIAS